MKCLTFVNGKMMNGLKMTKNYNSGKYQLILGEYRQNCKEHRVELELRHPPEMDKEGRVQEAEPRLICAFKDTAQEVSFHVLTAPAPTQKIAKLLVRVICVGKGGSPTSGMWETVTPDKTPNEIISGWGLAPNNQRYKDTLLVLWPNSAIKIYSAGSQRRSQFTIMVNRAGEARIFTSDADYAADEKAWQTASAAAKAEYDAKKVEATPLDPNLPTTDGTIPDVENEHLEPKENPNAFNSLKIVKAS